MKRLKFLFLTVLCVLAVGFACVACNSTPEHIHDWGEWTVGTAPTLTTAGELTRTCQNDETHKETQALPALNETDYTYTVEKAATCTEAGEGKYTTKDGKFSFTADIPALGHDWGEWTVGTAPTLTTAGELTRTCQNDAAHQETQALPALNETDYTYTVEKAATCTEAGEGKYTTKDGKFSFTADIPALGHDWNEWTVGTAPTLTTAGELTRTCQNDAAHKETETLPALNATDYTYTVGKAATCTEAGEGKYTTKDGPEFSFEVSLDVVSHQWSDWTLTTQPDGSNPGIETRTCAVGHETEERIIETQSSIEAKLAASDDVTVDLYAGHEYDFSELTVGAGKKLTVNGHGAAIKPVADDAYVFLARGDGAVLELNDCNFEIKGAGRAVDVNGGSNISVVMKNANVTTGKNGRLLNVTGSVTQPDGTEKYTYSGIHVTLDHVTFDSEKEGESTTQSNRGVGFWHTTDSTLTIRNSSIKVGFYALNIQKDKNLKVDVTDSTIQGWCALNDWSCDSRITFDNCDLIGYNTKSGTSNSFSVLVVDGGNLFDSPAGTGFGNIVTVKNSRVKAIATTECNEAYVSQQYGAAANKVEFINTTFSAEGAAITNNFQNDDLARNEVTIDGVSLYGGVTATTESVNGKYVNKINNAPDNTVYTFYNGTTALESEGGTITTDADYVTDCDITYTTEAGYIVYGNIEFEKPAEYLTVKNINELAAAIMAAQDGDVLRIDGQNTRIYNIGDFPITHSITLIAKNIKIEDAAIRVSAPGVVIAGFRFVNCTFDVTTDGAFTFAGNTFSYTKAFQNVGAGGKSNAAMLLKASGKVTITHNTFDSGKDYLYNGIEFGLDTQVADGTSVSDNRFIGTFRNNCVSIYATADNAVIDLNGNTFAMSKNGYRFSNSVNHSATFHIFDNRYDATGTDDYAGLMLFQDYSKDGTMDFGKYTVNVQNLTGPDGEQVTQNGIGDRQVYYVYEDMTASIVTDNNPQVNFEA